MHPRLHRSSISVTCRKRVMWCPPRASSEDALPLWTQAIFSKMCEQGGRQASITMMTMITSGAPRAKKGAVGPEGYSLWVTQVAVTFC